MNISSQKENTLLALSGGVDSAVSAAILKQSGTPVEAVYVRTWEHEGDVLGDCPGARDLADAEKVCDHLKIPFRVVNFVDFYQREVVDPMIDGYAKGITPNPDILCNRRMKFGALWEYAQNEGFDALATGHYCIRKVGINGLAELWEGKDKNKDQSYFLARLTIKQLQSARFPLGEIDKAKVRKMANELGLAVADKKDSQGICFLGKVKVPEFLSHYIKDAPGNIVNTEGKILGNHLGLHRYTIGQRKGIGVPSNTDHQNYVVTGKDQEKNQLIVAFDRREESSLWANEFNLQDVTFLDESYEDSSNLKLLGKARYRDPSTPIQLNRLDSQKNYAVTFSEPQRALTPGQVLAVYDGERLVGSGVYAHSGMGRACLSA